MEEENLSKVSETEVKLSEDQLSQNEEIVNNELNEEESDEVEELEEEEDDDEDDDEDEEYDGEDDKIAIDLSDNPVYRGLCTLLEDDEGNNLLEYISLLHSELIGHNKTMKGIKKDLGRIANAAEQFLKSNDK